MAGSFTFEPFINDPFINTFNYDENKVSFKVAKNHLTENMGLEVAYSLCNIVRSRHNVCNPQASYKSPGTQTLEDVKGEVRETFKYYIWHLVTFCSLISLDKHYYNTPALIGC